MQKGSKKAERVARLDPDTLALVGHLSERPLAELVIVVRALKVVEEKWRGLQAYFDDLLNEDFMDFDAYTRLIFDDDKLTKSRLYFWTLSCLHEFIVSLEDTLKQWSLFLKARVDPVWKPIKKSKDDSPEHRVKVADIRKVLDEGEQVQQCLKDILEDFRGKINVVKTFRDGVRNCPSLLMLWTILMLI